MRALLAMLLLVAACGKSEPTRLDWDKPVPADHSLELQGEVLDSFCHEQERKPGWTCDDYQNCETAMGDSGGTVCQAKPLADG